MTTKPTLAIYGIKDRNALLYSAFVHDHNLCLMQDGKVQQYLQLERYTRYKYDNRLDLFLEELIDNKLLDLPKEFDIVSVNNFVGNAFISKNGRIRFESSKNWKLSNKLEPAMAYYQDSDWTGKELNAFNCSHELAHIASCLPFYGNFMDNSLLVSFDGGSSLGNYSAFHYINGKLHLLENNWEQLGYLSKFYNDNALTFQLLHAKPGDHCSVPGKLMGYACWGSYDLKIEQWLQNHEYFKNYWNQTDVILQSIRREFGIEVTSYDTKHPFLQNIAATYQHIFERDFLNKITHLKELTNADFLYYAGGCALNILTNTRIIENSLFNKIFIPPCCNDSGLSIGAASFLESQKGNTIEIHSPYLCNVGLEKSQTNPVSKELIKAVADILLKGGIIGVCNGNAEIGPRALGNRSLLALANNKELSRKLSMDVKKREWYRPVAPIMLKEVAKMVTQQTVHQLSKYMLMDFTIKEEYCKSLEGVVHVNQTARIQVIEKEDNLFMYQLLKYLYDNYQVLALINTSFNVQGEPIVHTPQNAVDSAKKMKLDALIIDNQLFTNL